MRVSRELLVGGVGSWELGVGSFGKKKRQLSSQGQTGGICMAWYGQSIQYARAKQKQPPRQRTTKDKIKATTMLTSEQGDLTSGLDRYTDTHRYTQTQNILYNVLTPPPSRTSSATYKQNNTCTSKGEGEGGHAPHRTAPQTRTPTTAIATTITTTTQPNPP